MRLIVLFSSLLLCFSVTFAEEQEPKRGVLADGTPFRTDSEGNQIIDYIAELENSVDTLHRRVNGLEREVETKQALIERLQARVDIDDRAESGGRIREKDLVGTESTRENFAIEPVEAHPELPQARMPSVEDGEVTKVSINTTKLRDLETRNRVLEDTKETLTRRAEVVEAERDQIQQQYLDEKRKFEAALAEQARRISELEVTSRKVSIPGGQQRSDNLSVEGVEKVAEPSAPKVDMKVSVSEPNLADPETAIFKKPNPIDWNKREPLSDDPRASITPARTRALEATKGMVKTEINTLRGEIAGRDSLYEKYKAAPSSSVKFSLSKLESKRGYTLDEISRRLNSAQSVSSISELKRDVADIRRKVQDDKALIRRMGKF